MDCHVQIFLDNCWKTAAIFEPDSQTLDKGVAGCGRLQYDIDFAVTHLGNRAAELIPGLSVGFELFRFEQWPPFLVDLLPGGAGRRVWLRRMQAENDGPQMDWHLLTKGAGAPPGNLRIAEAVLRTNGQVRLSPLFDFAPMFLDPEGIGRASRWEDEQPGNQPEWAVICEKLKNVVNPIETRTWLSNLGEDVKRLPETMQDCHVDDVIIQRLAGWIDEVAAGLAETQPRTWT
jgi:serine/threonine-protein kinase HipA